ncbi:hypothetical protein A2Y99_01165 [Candidatus Gottesmanbacteria bacterium RBG_13_37_7]|uniref:Diacylglycerol kinase n=1 Tax=Candidatus Gottesmanbacteria bacterium RBG_13_37_7 TaxID=1798369 RepID=A0A1F5YGK5_9BACT|nr:MAG: hypothetical protein A2Y99_01165 [Candidatus Gottesmanbacteria bacterium RBG_13_37_7]
MLKTIRKHHISFKNAFNGIRLAFTSQPNFRVHLSFSFLAIVLGVILRISYMEMVLLIFTIVFGLTVEMVNTSIEAMTDLITKEWKVEAKIAKDIAAGMMLLTAIGAVFVAILIFIPYLIQII